MFLLKLTASDIMVRTQDPSNAPQCTIEMAKGGHLEFSHACTYQYGMGDSIKAIWIAYCGVALDLKNGIPLGFNLNLALT